MLAAAAQRRESGPDVVLYDAAFARSGEELAGEFSVVGGVLEAVGVGERELAQVSGLGGGVSTVRTA